MRTIYYPEGNGQMFTASLFVGVITYSRFLTDKFSVGLTFKYIQEDFWEYKAKNWAFDIGTYYDTGFHSLVLGMSILNFGPEMSFDGSYIDYSDPVEGGEPGDFEVKNFAVYPLPLTFRFGMAMYVYNREDIKVLIAVDTHKPNDNRQHVNAGTEITFMDMLMLRAGYRFRYDQGGFCFGAGFKYNLFADLNIRLDYSYADMGVFNAVHRGTFGVSF